MSKLVKNVFELREKEFLEIISHYNLNKTINQNDLERFKEDCFKEEENKTHYSLFYNLRNDNKFWEELYKYCYKKLNKK